MDVLSWTAEADCIRAPDPGAGIWHAKMLERRWWQWVSIFHMNICPVDSQAHSQYYPWSVSVFIHHVFFSPSECTFIILDKQKWADPSIPELECMVGDVNIFLTDPSDPSLAELEIMIAGYRSCSAFYFIQIDLSLSITSNHFLVPFYRGKGLGKEITRMMMYYGRTKMTIKEDLLLVVTTSYM